MREAERIAEMLGDRRRQSGAAARMVESFRVLGQYDESVDAGERALRLASRDGDEALHVFVMFELAQTHQMRGALRHAADAIRAGLQVSVNPQGLRQFGLRPTALTNARPNLAWLLSELGDFDEAITHGTEGVRLGAASGIPTHIVSSRNIVGYVYFQRGDVARAGPFLEHGVDLAQVNLEVQIWTLAQRGATHTLAGRAAFAIPILEEGLAVADGNGIISNRTIWATWLGEAYLADGRIAEARQIVADALVRATARQESAYRGYALRALGDIAARDGPPAIEEAEAHYREALKLAESLEMRPLQAHCHFGLGKLYRRVGLLDEARVELSTAVTMLREMGMAHWLPEAEAELAAADGPVAPRAG
jgi:tetratricopeptide (TPR) repeat protein